MRVIRCGEVVVKLQDVWHKPCAICLRFISTVQVFNIRRDTGYLEQGFSFCKKNVPDSGSSPGTVSAWRTRQPSPPTHSYYQCGRIWSGSNRQSYEIKSNTVLTMLQNILLEYASIYTRPVDQGLQWASARNRVPGQANIGPGWPVGGLVVHYLSLPVCLPICTPDRLTSPAYDLPTSTHGYVCPYLSILTPVLTRPQTPNHLQINSKSTVNRQ